MWSLCGSPTTPVSPLSGTCLQPVTIAAMASDAVWTVPEPHSVLEVQVGADAAIVVRRHGSPEGTRLVLCHGNGLAADLYYPFWSLLTDRFDVIVHDLRNHGWNPAGPLADHTVPTFVEDHERILDALDRHYGPKPQVGVFHSISALAPLLAPSAGDRFSALVLFDPPLRKPGATSNEFDAAAERAATVAARRASRFPTMDAFITLMGFLPVLNHTVPGLADLMARTTLRDASDGQGHELRCPPEHESQIVAYARIFAVLVDFDALKCPTKVIGADPTLPYSYLPTLDLSEMAAVDYDFLPETTHLLQLQQPAECVKAMLDFLEPIGLA
ncbi:MAG: alpha/beta hydrolase [Acidimicrobiaceae bacterium]|nr:alpha/beta hydrolase [Acidimicrobiaceae bacterium]MXZ99826.1 alpha/beta hydrolase [Acidimicrobiaceae bacterium]MYE75829.1 alpha/beta hydrolase [Acidimicrobiaceae bacterium]MYE96079.1 alpha/beta hydrolase [Acidimicrobiaceae bacterium]MYH42453.1 alpha/beta hydrolase [Acidimicrobiaceae bacterium]